MNSLPPDAQQNSLNISLAKAIREWVTPAHPTEAKLEWIEHFLEEGADPNEVTGGGMGQSAMAIAIHPNTNLENRERGAILSKLINHGGNPLDFPAHFRKLLTQNGYADVLLPALNIRERAGNGVRDAKGNNPIHQAMMVSSAWWEFGGKINAVARNMKTMGQSTAVFIWPQWLTQTNNEGQTPAHILWERVKPNTSKGKLRWPRMDNAWDLTAGMVALGVDFQKADNAGRRPVDMITELLRQGAPRPTSAEGNAALGQIMSFEEAKELEANTPKTGNYNRGGPRL